VDATEAFPGAMASLVNLIPAATTKNLWQCRPAASLLGNTTGNKVITATIIVGNRLYGMAASNTNAGKDAPFCFNLLTNTLVSISGITSASSPTSLATSGDWVPPSMALVGTKIMVAHQGFVGTANTIGWIETSNPSALAWSAGNTTTNALAYPPTAVYQFANRAWYAINPPTGQPSLAYSDVLVPTTITNSSQALFFGDNLPLTAMGGLGLTSTQVGGIVQALIVFKGVSAMWQITGDAALNNLTASVLSVPTGTLAPNTVCPTPQGLAFMSPDGMRYISPQGTVSEPVGDDGSGIALPFSKALSPSRAVAACNASVYRITVQNGAATGTPNQEYWFDLTLKIWSGPHTFPNSQIEAYNNTFICAPISTTGNIFASNYSPSLSDTYTENGTALSWAYQTSMLPDPSQMAQMSMIETTLSVTLSAGGGAIAVEALDQNGSVLGSYSIPAPGGSFFWGSFVWGVGLWRGVALALFPRIIKWTQPVEFRRLAISVSGTSGAGLQIGDVFMRYQILRYLQEPLSP
jgi:hypothetical protein